MEQLQFDDHFQGVGFDPIKQVDLTKSLDRRNQRLNRADEEALAQVIRNNNVRIQNAQDSGNDLIALSKFSSKLTNLVGDIAKEKEEEKKKEEFAGFLRRIAFGQFDMSGYNKTKALAKDQAHTAANAEASVLGEGGENYDASSPIGNSTALSSFQKLKADSMFKVISFRPDIDAVLDYNDPDRDSFTKALQEQTYEWVKKNGILGLPDEFLVDTILPRVIEEQQKAISAWSKLNALNDSQRRQDEAKAGLLADSDPTVFLDAVRNTVDRNGKTLGYGGAWTLLNEAITEARLAGLLTATDVEKMLDHIVPDDSKKRTYGELHKAKFLTIARQVSAEQRKIFQESEAERLIEFKQAEQERVDALLDLADKDGFTEELADQYNDQLRAKFGFDSQELEVIKKSSVDAKTRKVQETQIESLMAMNLLTPESLKRFDPKLQKKYRSQAQATANLRKENGDFKDQEEAIEDMVEHPVTELGIVKNHLNVGLMIAKQKRRFHQILESKVLAGDTDPVNSAFAQVKYEFENGGYFKKNGDPRSGVIDPKNPYDGVAPKFNPSEQQATQQEIIRMNSLLKSYGKSVLDLEDNGMNPVLFSKSQIEAMGKGYGEEGWSPSPVLEYPADILDMDSLSLYNKLRETNGMDALPATPAYEVIQNQLTPTQQRLLRQFKTPERTARALTGQSQYNPELVPGGYGKTIQEAASKYNIDPSILAGLLWAESKYLPKYIEGRETSSSGAIGIAQIMPDTAAQYNVDPTDPIASIYFAANYLRDIMDGRGTEYNRQVNLDTAIYMYNAGPNYKNLSTYPLPGENAAYLGKVKEGAAMYGNGKQALSDPGTMRSSIQQQL